MGKKRKPVTSSEDNWLDDVSDEEDYDRRNAVTKQMDDLKSTMLCNIDLLLNRGDKIDEINDSSDTLQEDSKGMAGEARKVPKRMKVRNAKLTCLILLVIIVGLIIMIVLVAILLVIVFLVLQNIGDLVPLFERGGLANGVDEVP